MSNDLENASESGQRIAFTVLGLVHLAVTVALSWALAIILTPPNKPVENGLETLFPGLVIALLGLPFALAGAGLMQQGVIAVKTALQVDAAAIIVITLFFFLDPDIWVASAGLPFAIDLVVLLVLTGYDTRTSVKRAATLLMWIGIAVLAAVLYGIINDQITVTISPEYYSVFKRDQFAPVLEHTGMMDAPTRIQAVIIGTLATWWYGLFLGIMLGISSMVGRYAPLSTERYVRAVGSVMMLTLGTSVLFGGVAYLIEPLIVTSTDLWPFLAGIEDVRGAFAVGWWHNGAYLGALIAAVVASFWAQKERKLIAKSG